MEISEDTLLDELGVPGDDVDPERVHVLLNVHGRIGSDVARLLCSHLFALGRVRDSKTIAMAKGWSVDHSASIEIQLLAGAGVEQTVKWLKHHDFETHIRMQHCIAAGDFAGFTPEGWLRQLREYYGS